MKTVSTLIICLLISYNTLGQKLIDVQDEFTGDKITYSTFEKFWDGFPVRVKYHFNKQPYILDMAYNSGSKCYTIYENADFFIKLSNGDKINLKINNTDICDYQSTEFYSHFINELQCILYSEDLKLLQSHDIIKVRFYTSDGYIEHEVKKRNAKKLKNLFNIIPIL